MKKTILKIAAILILFGILIGISIIKSSLSDGTQASVSDKELEEYFNTRDSVLLRQFDDTTRFYVDSLLKLEFYFQFQIDSLNEYFKIHESELIVSQKIDTIIIKDTVRITQKNSSPPQDSSTPKKSEKKSVSASNKIRKEFNSILAQLPNDLTKYELRVSRDEIIVELSKKFKLPPKTVKKYIK